MKTIKILVLVLAVVFSIILVFGMAIISFKVFQLPILLTPEGFRHFLSSYSVLKELFTIAIGLLTAYFIIFQIENFSLSIKTKTFEQSKFFYIEIQPLIHDIYKLIKPRSEYLLSQTWNYSEFTDQSVNEQNPKWEIEYENMPQEIKDRVIRILNNLEYLSSNVINGSIDQQMAYDLFGRPLVSQLRIFYPFISGYRTREMKTNEYRYNSIVTLFKKWNDKM
jgi:hypothetical protein